MSTPQSQQATPPEDRAAQADEPEGLTRQPNSKNCFVCGLENEHGLGMVFHNAGPGRVQARYTVPQRFEGFPGVVHGGIIASMLDEAVGRVVMTEDPNHFLVTAKLELRYRAPVPLGEELLITGELQEKRRRFTRARGQITLPDGTVGAEAESLLADRPGQQPQEDTLAALGWQVYPD